MEHIILMYQSFYFSILYIGRFKRGTEKLPASTGYRAEPYAVGSVVIGQAYLNLHSLYGH
jgi:hypothetical protein